MPVAASGLMGSPPSGSRRGGGSGDGCKILDVTPNNLPKDLLPTGVLAVGAIAAGNVDSGSKGADYTLCSR